MLRYEVKQVYLEDLGRYYLPIPKFGEEQLDFLASDLGRRGFEVAKGRLLKARGDGTRFTINPAGLVSSSDDLLDSALPSVVNTLGFESTVADSNPYFAAKRKADHVEVQFFPRMEGLRIWTSLRRQNECGLTPDEATILKSLLGRSKRLVDCVTDYPTDGCTPIQMGRRQYYSSRVSPAEFLSNLRTLTHRPGRSSYLPRTSLFQVDSGMGQVGGLGLELREWCFLRLHPQNL